MGCFIHIFLLSLEVGWAFWTFFGAECAGFPFFQAKLTFIKDFLPISVALKNVCKQTTHIQSKKIGLCAKRFLPLPHPVFSSFVLIICFTQRVENPHKRVFLGHQRCVRPWRFPPCRRSSNLVWRFFLFPKETNKFFFESFQANLSSKAVSAKWWLISLCLLSHSFFCRR